MSNQRFNFDSSALSKTKFKLLYISTSKYEGDWQSLPHTHHFSELFYVVSGNGNFLVDKEVISVKENDLVIVNPNIAHTEMSQNSKPLEYVVFGVEGMSFDFGNEEFPKNYGIFAQLPNKTVLLQLFRILLQEISTKGIHYELVCHDTLEVVLIYLMRACRLRIVSAATTRIPKDCALVKRYLDTNYSQHITLDFLAEVTHTNKYYLAHTFTNHLGMSPINYLIQRRLTVGKELLTSTDHSIAQITSSIGFSSQSYFSQIFKKHNQMSPQQYRKRNHINAKQEELS